MACSCLVESCLLDSRSVVPKEIIESSSPNTNAIGKYRCLVEEMLVVREVKIQEAREIGVGNRTLNHIGTLLGVHTLEYNKAMPPTFKTFRCSVPPLNQHLRHLASALLFSWN